MKTGIKWGNLKKLPDDQRLKVLVGAISWELSKPMLALECAQRAALARPLGLPAAAPEFARIKSFLGMKYATASDTPELTDLANQMEQFFHTNMPELDLAFTLLFDLIDLRASTHDHFDILDTNAGLTFTQRLPGQKTEIRRNISEAKTTVSYLEFSDGLGLLDTWLQFNQFWNIDEAVAEFTTKYYDKMAELHYALFTAIGSGIDIAFDTDDVKTANKAAASIMRATRSKGYGSGTNAVFYALCAPEHVGRLERMLTAQRGSAIVDFGTMKEPLSVRIQGVIGTTYVPAASTGWYLVLPGRKLKRGVWKDLMVESARNIYVSAEDLVGTGQYNAAVGDTDQVRRVLFS